MRKNLIRERKRKLLTQAEISRIVGITPRHYINLETGQSKGSVDVWERLKCLLGKPIDYLLAQDSDHNQSQVKDNTQVKNGQ